MTVLTFLDHQYLQSIGSLATASGVLVAAFQLRRSKLQAITAFEDDLAKEYRDICNKLPTKVFFRQRGRLSKKTWEFWADGMNANLALAGFSMAWSQIGPRIGKNFLEFKRAVEEGFARDPKDWHAGGMSLEAGR